MNKKPKPGWYKVKTWEAMEKEFGIGAFNYIRVPLSFNTEMEKLVCTFSNRKIFAHTWDYNLIYKTWRFFYSGYHWSIEMLEPLDEYLDLHF